MGEFMKIVEYNSDAAVVEKVVNIPLGVIGIRYIALV